jgi:hypothetical protein
MRLLRRRSARLALAAAAVCGAWFSAVHAYRESVRVSFARDIAPIGFAHCAPCHRPGQPGPFSLLSYADYRAHGHDIADVVEDRFMPPWKPHDRSGMYLGQRTLRDDEIALIRRWVDDGMAEGDARDLPALPLWSKDWQLGEPDAVVRLSEPYRFGGSGDDEYRNFVIASPVAARRYVIGWEFRPGNRAIHHAILKIDRMGNARRADAADPGPGFSEMEFDGAQAPDGFYLVWAPGKTPRRQSDGSAWRIDGATDLVLQLHLQRSGKSEVIDPSIALYFSSEPPTQRRFSLRIGDPPIDIPAGAADYRIADSYTLPADVRLLGLFPHAHYLAKRMRVFSRLPDGRELELLRIDDWDFNWQDEYTFATPPLLPRGSTLQMEFAYDNSLGNEQNPNHPPQRVRSGSRSVDEMGNVTFQAMPVHPEQLDALLESKYRRLLGPAPSAEALYNLANALARQDKRAEAAERYEAAIAKDPQLAAARFNYAGLLLAQREPDKAVVQLERVLLLRPDDSEARLALGHAFELLGRSDGAIAQYRAVLAADPKHALALRLLAEAQRKTAPLTR